MIEGTLDENQEQAVDQLSALFYQEGGDVYKKAEQLLANFDSQSKQEVLDATINRVHGEQRIRREYLKNLIQPQQTEDGSRDIEQQLSELDAVSITVTDPAITEQLRYYQIATSNIYLFESDTWKEKNRHLLLTLINSGPELTSKTESHLEQYVNTFYNGGGRKNIVNTTVPQAVVNDFTELGIAAELAKYETIVGQSMFCFFILKCYQLIGQLKDQSQEEIINALASSTLDLSTYLDV